MNINILQALDEIMTQGYTIIENALDNDLRFRLSAAMDRLKEEDNCVWGKEYLHRIGQEGFIINVGDRDQSFQQLLENMPTLPLVDAILGENAFLYLFQGVIVPPGGGMQSYPWKWHCDLYHVAEDVSEPTFIPGINSLFYLDDVNSDNGGTWVIPGSQGLSANDMVVENADFIRECAIQVESPAGSALVFNPLLWHCAGANKTGLMRRAVKMLMVRDWMLPQMDYSRSIRQEIMQTLNKPAKRILGCNSMIPRSFKEA